MPDDEPLSLNLNAPAASPHANAPLPVEQLQFRRAEPAVTDAAARRCAACKSPIYSTYFQISGQDICQACSERIQNGQKAPPMHSLLKAALFGGGAALAGCAIYAAVAIIAHLELALLAILIGLIVGKAVRRGSDGLGGRPQQILAVLLTYFAITFSYVVVYIYGAAQKPTPNAQKSEQVQSSARPAPAPQIGIARAVVVLVSLAAIAPFLELGSNFVSGLLSLVIIFIGLRQAWRLTGRSDILILGPYTVSQPS